MKNNSAKNITKKKINRFAVLYCGVCVILLLCAAALFSGCPNSGLAPDPEAGEFNQKLVASRSEAVNPLKGFYCWEKNNSQDCSLEYVPVKFSDLMIAKDTVDFTKLEEQLNGAKERHHQAVLRIVIDDGQKDDGTVQFYLPSYISEEIENDAKTERYAVTKDNQRIENVAFYEYTRLRKESDGRETPLPGKSPNYNHPKLYSQIEFLINELGKKYDGDPRIALIETGILGHWGEQHTTYLKKDEKTKTEHPGTIKDSTYKKFYKTFSDSFKVTLLAAGSPKRPGSASYSNIGFYQDSLWKDSADKSFVDELKKNKADDRWQTSMISGEIARLAKEDLLSKTDNQTTYKNFQARMNELHVSSVLFSSAFNKTADSRNIRIFSSAMGYNFIVDDAFCSVINNKFTVSIKIINNGCAKFYYKWPVYISVLKDGKLKTYETDWDITTIDAESETVLTFETEDIPLTDGGNAKVFLSIPNPMEGGFPVSFDNEKMDFDLKGYLTLGTL